MTRRSDWNGARSSWPTEKSMAPLIEVLPANDRGTSTSLSPKLRAASPSAINVQSTTTVCMPVRRPFDKTHGNAPVRAGCDGPHHVGIRDGGSSPFALQLEFVFGHAARDVGGEHQQQIDRFCRPRRRRTKASTPGSAAQLPFSSHRSFVDPMAGPAADGDGLSDCWQEHDVDQRKVMTPGKQASGHVFAGTAPLRGASSHAHTDRGRPARLTNHERTGRRGAEAS